MNPSKDPANRVIVIGLDGATFDLFGPWMEAGDLPNLARLCAEGARGRLRSCLPPVTSPAWKCFSTGKNPGRLGVFWWRQVDRAGQRIIGSEARLFQSREIWDVLGDGGLRVDVVGMPLSYPPRRVNGFMVSGGPYAGESGFTEPAGLQAELKERFGYQLHPQRALSRENRASRAIADEILALTAQRFDAAEHLLEHHDPDFLCLVLFYLNNLQHFCWQEEPVRRVWRLIDERLGRFIRDDVNLFLVSDHGLARIERVFYVQTWLRREGLLVLRPERFGALERLRLSRDLVRTTARILRLDVAATRLLGRGRLERLIRHIPFRESRVREAGAFERRLDWERTRALALPQGPLYLLGEPDPAAREARVREITERLKGLVDPLTGRCPIRKVHRREEIYKGPYMEDAPDLVLEPEPGYHIREGEIGSGEIFADHDEWQADNHPEGILIARGPDVRAREEGNAEIIDLAPTVVHLMGLPVPDDMDGRVLEEIFRQGSEAARRPVRRAPAAPDLSPPNATDRDEAAVAERLRDLGYLE